MRAGDGGRDWGVRINRTVRLTPCAFALPLWQAGLATLDGPCATVPVLAAAWSSDEPAARLCQYAIVMPLLHPLVTGEEGGLATIPFDLRLRVVTQLAESLAVMHDLPHHLAALGGGAGGGGGGAGTVAILHGDIKPANVLLDAPIAEWGAGGAQQSARFADFGNAVLREGTTIPLMRPSAAAARRWTPAYGHPALAETPALQYSKVGRGCNRGDMMAQQHHSSHFYFLPRSTTFTASP